MRTGPVYWKARRIMRGLSWHQRVITYHHHVNAKLSGIGVRMILAEWMVNRGRKPRDHVRLDRIASQGRTIKAILVQHKLGMIREMKVYR